MALPRTTHPGRAVALAGAGARALGGEVVAGTAREVRRFDSIVRSTEPRRPLSERASASAAYFHEQTGGDPTLGLLVVAPITVHLDGHARWFGCGRYLAPQGESLHGAPLAGTSIDPDDPLFAELEAVDRRLLGAFAQVPDGCTHLEVLRCPDGRFTFLEVAARTCGCRMPEMHQIHRGVDLRRAHYQVAAGLPVDLEAPRGPHAAWYSPMKTEPGAIARTIDPPFTCAHTGEWQTSWLTRTDVARTMSMDDCLGFFTLWDDDRARLDADLARLEGFRAYELVQPDRGARPATSRTASVDRA